MKKKLALGHQEFSELINNNCIYVDKTETIFKLINTGSYYLLSRPRRFGKSLLANTLKELFLGNKKLFKGLWIYDKWDRATTYPVIKISFSNISNNLIGIEQALHNRLSIIANENKILLEKESYSEKFQELIIKLSKNGKVAMHEIKKWYNGYSWDGTTRLYNPVSVMNLFKNGFFKNYWFSAGTLTMLMDIIRTRKLTAFDIENTYISSEILDKYDFKNINFRSLLFQTGYLTIKKYDIIYDEITLEYPNQEVAKSFSAHILSELTIGKLDDTDNLLHKIRRSFLQNQTDKFIEYVNAVFKTIPYSIVEEKEKYYHSLFYLIIKLIGFNIEAEIKTIDGRIDAVVKTDDNIYMIEFKINQSAQKAIQQIKDKKYALKYADDKRPVTLLGINFDTEKKRIEDYLLI